jgi:hypothetical protein
LNGPVGAVSVIAVRSTAIALKTVPRGSRVPSWFTTTTCEPMNRYVPGSKISSSSSHGFRGDPRGAATAMPRPPAASLTLWSSLMPGSVAAVP